MSNHKGCHSKASHVGTTCLVFRANVESASFKSSSDIIARDDYIQEAFVGVGRLQRYSNSLLRCLTADSRRQVQTNLH